MKTIHIFLSSALLLIFSCSGQTDHNKKETAEQQRSHTDTNAGKPDVRVKVNKQYDKHGNVIRYDSTYSYSYSNRSNGTHVSNDSIFNQFRSFFDETAPDFFNRQNGKVFFNDTLFAYDFFNDDFFRKRFELNRPMYDRFFWQMDSLKSVFFDKNYKKDAQGKTGK